MNPNNKKRQKYLTIGLVTCALYGLWLSRETSTDIFLRLMILWLLFVFCLPLSYLLNIVCHELGHLLFGLLAGYQFRWIGFGNLIIMKKEGRLRFASFAIPGSGGSTFMYIPKIDNMKAFYRFWRGGIVMNGLLSVIGLVLMIVFRKQWLVSTGFALLLLMSLYSVVLNVSKDEQLRTDGYNIAKFKTDQWAIDYYLIENHSTELYLKGYRTSQLPPELVIITDDLDLEYIEIIKATEGDLLMDQHEFLKFIQRMEPLIEDERIWGASKFFLMNNLLYCYCVSDGYENQARELYMRLCKSNYDKINNLLSFARTKYAYFKLIESNEEETLKQLNYFRAHRQRMPYEGEIETENGLIMIAMDKTK